MGGSTSKEELVPLEVVDHVDLEKYVGMWYEYGRYPNRFQAEDGENVTATYTLNEDETIKVVNEEFIEGKKKTINGKAWVHNKEESTSKLKVSFFWPFAGNYWVIQLGENYEYAVVGEPKRKYLWILSRTTEIPEEIVSSILTKLKEQGYDPEKVKMTKQVPPREEATNTA
ncbi:hypothetical protein NDN08_008212 [Rhodosorus marinus]|uniref:Lipocalin/cytosolic fatty-acid binding domain-containing protein n=1 Tax=Rhodosorus marinus TaxID=101924 RepID=A0AAV8V394_9RHOD|nr:hypothetical protein NDN08_008212 [Rhodosorus marinus]